MKNRRQRQIHRDVSRLTGERKRLQEQLASLEAQAKAEANAIAGNEKTDAQTSGEASANRETQK
jgi:hypothetical protein